jgi:hypothetical protein
MYNYNYLQIKSTKIVKNAKPYVHLGSQLEGFIYVI